MTAALVISHGSRSAKTIEEVSALIRQLDQAHAADFVHYAFLEIASPTIPEGIAECVRRGADQIIILLNFLNSGQHVDQDIPRILKAEGVKYPQVRFRLTPPVGQHPRITELFLNMIRTHE